MADNKVKISFEIDGIEYTTDQLEQMGKASKDAAKATDELGKSAVEAGDEVEDAGQKFTKTQTKIRETRIELQKAAAAGDKVKFEQLKGQLDDLEEGLEKTTFQSQQFDDQLSAIPGPAGAVGGAIKQMDGLFKMLAANPVIAIIAVVAGLFMLLKESMEKTSAGQKVLNKITEAFGKILGPVMLVVQKVAMPLFEGLLYIIEKVADGFQYFAEALGFSEKEIAESSKGVDKVREETEAKEKKRADDAKKRADDAKEQAEQAKKNAEEQAQKEKEAYEKRKAAAEEYAQNQKEINNTLATLRRGNIKDAEEKLKAELDANRAAAVEDLKSKKATKAQIAALNAEYDKIDQAALKAFNDEKLAKTAAAEEALNDLKDQNRLLSITNERLRAFEELKIQEQEAIEAVSKEENAAAQIEQVKEQYRLLTKEKEAEYAVEDQEKYAEDLQKKLEQQIAEFALIDNLAIADREKKLADANTYFDNLLLDEKLTSEQRIAIEKQRGEVIKGIETDIKNSRKAALDAVQGTFNALGSIFEQGSKEAKAFAVADAIINTYKSANLALGSAPPPFNFILAAANVAAGIANVKKIISTKPGTSTVPSAGGGGGGGAPTPPVPDISQVFQAVNSTGSNAVPQGAGVNGQPVVKAYVVASDMTTQQEANSKIQNLATL